MATNQNNQNSKEQPEASHSRTAGSPQSTATPVDPGRASGSSSSKSVDDFYKKDESGFSFAKLTESLKEEPQHYDYKEIDEDAVQDPIELDDYAGPSGHKVRNAKFYLNFHFSYVSQLASAIGGKPAKSYKPDKEEIDELAEQGAEVIWKWTQTFSQEAAFIVALTMAHLPIVTAVVRDRKAKAEAIKPDQIEEVPFEELKKKKGGQQ